MVEEAHLQELASGLAPAADGWFVVNGRPWPGMAGGEGVVYPRSELALRHGAGVETEVTSPPEAWAQLGAGPWRLERPHDWNALPWA